MLSTRRRSRLPAALRVDLNDDDQTDKENAQSRSSSAYDPTKPSRPEATVLLDDDGQPMPGDYVDESSIPVIITCTIKMPAGMSPTGAVVKKHASTATPSRIAGTPSSTRSTPRRRTALDYEFNNDADHHPHSDESDDDLRIEQERALAVEARSSHAQQHTQTLQSLEKRMDAGQLRRQSVTRSLIMKNSPNSPSDGTPKRQQDQDTPLRRLGLKQSSQFLDNTPRTRHLRRRNVLNNALKKLRDDAGSDESDDFLEFESESSSSDDDDGGDVYGSGDDDDDGTPSKFQPQLHSLKKSVRFGTPESQTSTSRTKRQRSLAVQLDFEHLNKAKQGDGHDEERDGDISTDSDDQSNKPTGPRNEFAKYFDRQYRVHHLKPTGDSELPSLDLETYTSLLATVSDPLLPAKRELCSLHTDYFSQWHFQLQQGFNLMMYGLGSKRDLLMQFMQERCLTARDHLVVVNGVLPGLNVGEVLRGVLEECVQDGQAQRQDEHGEDGQDAFQYQRGLLGLAERVARYFTTDPTSGRLYLLVHNLDGPPLRHAMYQHSFAVLAQAPRIHLVASMDHLNAGILWDQHLTDAFKFVFHDVTTFMYHDTEWLLNTIGQQAVFLNAQSSTAKEHDVRGMMWVLKSLTKNAQEIFKVLVQSQLEQLDRLDDDGQREQGLAYPVFYRLAQEHFLTASDMNFRTQLTEFKDHQMVKSRVGEDGQECVYVPLGRVGLERVLAEWQQA